MRILAVCKGFSSPRGGAQSMAKDLSSRVQKHSAGGVEAPLVTLMSEPDSITTHARAISGSPLSHIKWYLKSSAQLRKEFQNHIYDLCHLHCYSGFFTKPSLPERTIVTLHDEPIMDFYDNVSPIHARVLQYGMRESARLFRNLALREKPWIHAPSSTVRSQLLALGWNSDLIRVIPYGILPKLEFNPGLPREDALEYVGLPKDARYVLCVGNLNFRKGAYRILEACEHLSRAGENIQVVMVGRISNMLHRALSHVLRKKIAKLGLTNFHLTGFIPRQVLDGLFWSANTFLSASYSETGPMTLGEAARVGIPIVTTDVGAARDYLEGQATLLPRHCTSWDISDALMRSCSSRRRNYRCVEEFSWSRVIQQLVDFYYTVYNHA